jgi:hypothetical protein
MGKNKKKARNNGGSGTWKWIVGTLLVAFGIWLGYYEWKEDRKPRIVVVDYVSLGQVGRSELYFQGHYKNVGKIDARDVLTESRFFTAVKYDSDLSITEKMQHSSGTVGPGQEFYNVGHKVTVENSVLMASPSIDTNRVWWHERISYKDEGGKAQEPLDNCMVWDRKSTLFLRCPKE